MNYWIELAITNDRQDLADRITALEGEIKTTLTGEVTKQPDKPKSPMLECWERNLDGEETLTFVEFKKDDRWFLKTFGDDAEVVSQLTEIPCKQDTNPISLTLLKTDSQISFLTAALKEKELGIRIVPYTIEKSHPPQEESWADRINELDDAELVKLFEESFGMQPLDLVGLRTEWKAFVNLVYADFDDIGHCWNDFAASDRANWAADNEEELREIEEEEEF